LQPPKSLAPRASFRELYDAVLAAYSDKKRALDGHFVLYRLLYRPLSFPLTVLFIRAGFSANGVSYLNAMLLCLVLGLLLAGSGPLLVCAALLFLLFYVLDFVDGNLARYHNQSSYFGKLIDGTIDTIGFLLFAAVALGNVRSGLNWLPAGVEIALGVATTLTALLNQNFQYRLAYLRLESGAAQPAARQAAGPTSARGVVALGNRAYQNALVSTPVLLLPAAAFGALTAFTVFFFAVHGVLGVTSTALALVRTRRTLDLPRTH
jgi:phosphatidylglycerophosphate synthase